MIENAQSSLLSPNRWFWNFRFSWVSVKIRKALESKIWVFVTRLWSAINSPIIFSQFGTTTTGIGWIHVRDAAVWYGFWDLNFKNREIQENWKSSSKMTLAPMEFCNFLFFHQEWSYEHRGTGGRNAHRNSWSQFAYRGTIGLIVRTIRLNTWNSSVRRDSCDRCRNTIGSGDSTFVHVPKESHREMMVVGWSLQKSITCLYPEVWSTSFSAITHSLIPGLFNASKSQC